MTDDYDAAADSADSYNLAISCLRQEWLARQNAVAPPATEQPPGDAGPRTPTRGPDKTSSGGAHGGQP